MLSARHGGGLPTVVKTVTLALVAFGLELVLYVTRASIGPFAPLIGLLALIAGVGLLLAPMLSYRRNSASGT